LVARRHVFTRAVHFLRDKQDCDRAIKDMNEAIRREPGSLGYYNIRGMAYDCKDDREHAIADYTEAIRISPNKPALYTNRAIARKAQGDTAGEQHDLAAAARVAQRGFLESIVTIIRYW